MIDTYNQQIQYDVSCTIRTNINTANHHLLTDAPLEITKTKDFIEQVRGHQAMRYRIRKLTPRECFRLMGVDDKDINTIQAAGISNSQQYKLAGNSIVVDVLYHIFRKTFIDIECEEQQLKLF